ncbi:MAG: helix-turn-helix transcriptional regulator [Lachnospiraceae bacterium]|nr:helix-turn-helix transcriptional regulator [Lachnospiraceae bacterium]
MITGKDLKEARQRKRLSQEEVAELSGYSVRQISRLENDNNIVQLQRNMKLLSCLDLIKIEE